MRDVVKSEKTGLIGEGIIEVTKRARASIIAALCILAGCAQVASATDIPSNASGDYVGNGWSCRVLAYQHPTSALNNVLEFACVDADNVQRLGATTYYGCPTTGVQLFLAAWSSANPLAPILSGYQQGQITLVVGPAAVLLNRAQVLPSPRPYLGCGASTNVPPWPPLPSPHYARLCAQFGLFCGG